MACFLQINVQYRNSDYGRQQRQAINCKKKKKSNYTRFLLINGIPVPTI